MAGTWFALNRAGDYSNGDTECLNQGHVSFVPNGTTTTYNSVAANCGDYDHTSSSHSGQSGEIQLGSTSFTFGDFQANIQFSGGHPTFWLLGGTPTEANGCQIVNEVTADNVTYMGQTCDWNNDTNDSGEVDIAEIKTGQTGTSVVWQNICSANSDTDGGYSGTCMAFSSQHSVSFDVTAGFHVYEIKWTSTQIQWLIDGTVTNTATTRVPQHPMFVIFNEVGDSQGTPTNGSQMTIQWFKHCPSTCANNTNYVDTNADFSDNFTPAGAPNPPTNLTVITE